jgi:hypothetical protein
MSTRRVPVKRFKTVSEVRNCAARFDQDLAHTSKGDTAIETISGTTYTITPSTDNLALASVAATTSMEVIDGTTVTIGQGIKWRVSGGVAGQIYDVTFIVTTSLSQTLYGTCPIKVIANSA